MNKNILIIAAAMIFHTACTSGNASNKGPVKEQKSYPVVPVLLKDTILQLQYVADIQARKNVELHARVEGVLEKIYVDEGQNVSKGQLLFKINDEELLIQRKKTIALLNSAKAEAKVAEVEKERVSLLVEKKIVSATELDLANAKLNALKARISVAEAEKAAVEKQISYTAVHSPFDGIIDRLPLKAGSLLSNGSLLTTISDIHSMHAYFNVPENEYFRLVQANELNNNYEIKLILADGSTYKHSGKTETSESEIDDETGSIAFRVNFPNPERILKHGASGTLVISKPVSDAIMIPQKAVFEIQDKNYVYVLGVDNKVRMTPFEPAQRISDFYIVRSGLKGNERIVYEGIQSIRDGETIKPVSKIL
jgi:membrane fusion protein (multidrug efflux system)